MTTRMTATGRRYRIWKWLDRMLVLCVIVLLALVVFERHGRLTEHSGEAKKAASLEEATHTANPRTMPDAASVVRQSEHAAGARPVSLGGAAFSRDKRPLWRERGVRHVEWNALPYAPGMDIVQTELGYVAAFSLPGIREENIQVDCADGLLAIRIMIHDLQTGFHRDILRRIRLPTDSLSGGTLERTFSNGVLRVFVPRMARANGASDR